MKLKYNFNNMTSIISRLTNRRTTQTVLDSPAIGSKYGKMKRYFGLNNKSAFSHILFNRKLALPIEILLLKPGSAGFAQNPIPHVQCIIKNTEVVNEISFAHTLLTPMK